MSFDCKINPQLNVPIYKQLADSICFAIKKGELKDKYRLPTVNELSSELGIARGTVKKAYDELEISGVIEKVQGRGTFVSYRSYDSLSRKERAMCAIDDMLDKLEDIGFSAAEINIFLNLKLKERSQKTNSVKIAFFECNPENLSHISEQIRTIKNVELYTYLIDNVRTDPYIMEESFDLAVTTKNHTDEVKKLLPLNTRTVTAALRPIPECLSAIIKLRAGQKAGIACFSERFSELLRNTFCDYTENVALDKPFLFSPEKDIKPYLQDKNVIIVPEHYEKYCTADTAHALREFKGQLITFDFELDEGSLLYLVEKSKRITESKSV